MEKKCGFKPDRSDVIEFFNTLKNKPVVSETNIGRGSYFIYHNQTYQCRSTKEVVIRILQKFVSEKPKFYELCYKHQDNEGRSRRYIGRTPQELYQNRPDL